MRILLLFTSLDDVTTLYKLKESIFEIYMLKVKNFYLYDLTIQ